jgi:sugar lactone lactonase YvrE
MKRRLAVLALVLVLAVAGCVALALLLPGGIEPAAWKPPPAALPMPATELNEKLKRVERLGRGLIGPEAIAFDAQGRLLTGLLDGRVVRLTVGSDGAEVLVNTGGRPLAVEEHPTEGLVICDARLGLLALRDGGQLDTLATEEGGVPFRLADDLDIARDGVIFFTDASARRSLSSFTEDLLEHQTTGRVLAYEPTSQRVRRVAGGFNFANGLALGPDEAYLVVAETGAYRLWRVWLKGPRAGQKELFTDSLPGFPDNVRYAPARHQFWVAIGSLRKPEIDVLADWPMVRKVLARLPAALLPEPDRHAYVLAVDEEGRPVQSLQYRADDSYSPIASAVEHDGYLYLGSFKADGYARLKLEE